MKIIFDNGALNITEEGLFLISADGKTSVLIEPGHFEYGLINSSCLPPGENIYRGNVRFSHHMGLGDKR